MKLPLLSFSLLAMTCPSVFANAQHAPKAWQFDVYGMQMADADLQQDGEFGDSGFGAELAYRTRVNNKLILLIKGSIDQRYTDFSQTQLFNNQLTSFDERTKLGLGVTAIYRLDPHWNVIVAPRLQWAAAENASLSDSDSYGLLAGGMYTVNRDLQLGLGVSYLNDLEKTSTIVFPMIRWQINEKLKLDNPFAPGFAGRAGLELSYRWNPHFEFGLGGAFRSERFAVDDGVIEIEEPLGFGRITYFPNENWHISAVLGSRAKSEMTWEQNGIERKQDVDARLGFGVNAAFKF